MAEDDEPQFFIIDTPEKLAAWTGDIAAWNAWGERYGDDDFEPLDPERAVHPTLRRDAAMALWRHGKDVWNGWVEKNPKADVDFSFCFFESHDENRNSESTVSFEQYRFPEGLKNFKRAYFCCKKLDFNHVFFARGDVNFEFCNFGEGCVNFEFVNFGEGCIKFRNSIFGAGTLSFYETNFNNGDVDFYGLDFLGESTLFIGCKFGDGVVNFTNAKFSNASFSRVDFGNGAAIFQSVVFGQGAILFPNAKFGDGDVIFLDATFAESSNNFRDADFGTGEVCFMRATFGVGDVDFSHTTFGAGDVVFDSADFGDGFLVFTNASFGEGNVSFANAKFGEGNIIFDDVTFGDGDLSFDEVDFGTGDLRFDNAKLGKGDVTFEHASFGPGSVSLRNMAFQGIARFDYLKELEYCIQFSFEGCSFDKLLTFSHWGRMGCPLDLRRTKLTHGVILNDLKCDYVRAPASDWTARLSARFFKWPRGETPAWPLLKRAADPQDSQRFRRLKELAQNENNRAKALEFNAQELRSQRGHESHPLQDVLQFFYMLLSDYGRSVVRPLGALVVVTLLFGTLYARLATNPALTSAKTAWAAVTYSAGNMFAFVPISHAALEKSRTDLFCKLVPYDVMWLAGSQSVLSVILLFLLGLGLRNMFRL